MERRSEELLRERAARFDKALHNEKPGRVPYMPSFHYFPARYSGISYYEYAFDYTKFKEATLKVFHDFSFDIVGPVTPGAVSTLPLSFILFKSYPDLARGLVVFGTLHDILKDRYTRWPGRELSHNKPTQFIGGRFMEVEEYRDLARDPIAFISEKIIPRVYASLEKPYSPEAYGALIAYGLETAKFNATMMEISVELKKIGYPSIPLGFGYAPLDFIADFLRHITYTLIDLKRHPQLVEDALNSLTPLIVEWSKAFSIYPPSLLELFDIKTVWAFIPLHLNEMLPPNLFEKFYWEPLKRVIIELVNVGVVPWVFYEGDFTPFLHYMLELPKGKTVAQFERADLRKVREKLDSHVVIAGGLSPSLLIHGTPERVYEETCKLLNDVKEPGGFIFVGSGVSGVPDETKPENLKATINAVEKCGYY